MNQPSTSIPAAGLRTYEAAMLQSKAYRTLNKAFGSYLGEHHLSMSDWALLGMLTTQTYLTHADIAHQLDVTPTMVTKLVNNLEGYGYLLRQANSEDSRVKYVIITPNGRKFVDRIELQLRERMRDLMQGVSRKDLAIYLGVLSFLAASNDK